MKDDQSLQTTPPPTPASRLPFVTEEEIVPPPPPAPPVSVAPVAPAAVGPDPSSPAVDPAAVVNNMSSGSFASISTVPTTTTPVASVVPPVMIPPVKKSKIATKFIVGGLILVFLLISVPLGVYLLMNQSQDNREKATYDYVPPNPIQNQAPSSANSESLDASTPPSEDTTSQEPAVEAPSSPDDLSVPATVPEGGSAQ